MNKYFNNTNTLEELRKQYKELLKQHHPDNGGNVSDMQEINSEYDRLFKILKNQHESNKANSNNTNADYNNMKYDFAEDEKLREMLNKIIHFKGIDIELVGAWIWVSGNNIYQNYFRKTVKILIVYRQLKDSIIYFNYHSWPS